MNDMVLAFFLGVIEGLTEFLPVSSTGHLILFSDFYKLPPEKYNSFNIIIQLGAILAVVMLYPGRFKDFLDFNQFKKQHKLNALHIGIAIFPALFIGFLSRHYIKSVLMRPEVVVGSLIIVGVIMIILEKIRPPEKILSLDSISYKEALIIGLGQCCALIPGVSRSGATILTAMMRGFNLKVAADFSFLISVPIIGAATLYEFLKSYSDFSLHDLHLLLIGLVTSYVVAIIGIKFFIGVLKKLSLTPFAIYRILFGLIYYWILINPK
ncbi:MAG: undecaprenyl-diphosphate phosphatase [Bacteriovoracaceae bacterium]|jgi:undecaprenyl-diphosphatase|nr:undecaprenyl-diphosphate phosphatase [Bacteriovoracaceae bacterium]